jgi:hypothetical protein
VDQISIIGYSRRQSEFLTSAYSQWGFRSPERIREATLALESSALEPVLFSGLEQQLIASIINDFFAPDRGNQRNFDWHASYKEIKQLTQPSGAVVKCGVLPGKGSDNTLLQDFCEKAGLTLYDEMKEASQKVFNRSFDPDIIEAINNGVAFGLDMPGRHEDNEALASLSHKMVRVEKNQSEFLSNLKSYIDSYFFSSNQQLCQEYGLRESSFAPSARFTKQEISDLIREENEQRALHASVVINNYRMLSARMVELSLKLIKENRRIKNDRPVQNDPALKIWGRLRKLFKL